MNSIIRYLTSFYCNITCQKKHCFCLGANVFHKKRSYPRENCKTIIYFNQNYRSIMLSHNSKYYCKSITTNKVKSKSIHKFFTPGGTSSDKEQLGIHKIDVIKKRFVTFSVKKILVDYLFLPQTLCIFLVLCLKKKKT